MSGHVLSTSNYRRNESDLLGAMKPAYLLPIKEVTKSWRVRTDNGLSESEAQKRQITFGLNVIPQHKTRSPIFIFLDRFKDGLVLFLTAAAIISLVMNRVGDAIIIGLAIMLDTSLSYVQVWRTERTLERLRKHLRQTARVKRNGKVKQINAINLVPGDIIGFRAGERIPADARLITSQGLRMKESALTGEADDVDKNIHTLINRSPLGNRANMVFLGTTVTEGQGWAVVTQTGARTEFGKIAQMLKTQSSPVSPLRKKLNQTGMMIAWITVGLVLVVMGISLIGQNDWTTSIRTAVALIVSAIPEDLTVILTVALTIGVSRILKQRGLVRELAAGESLGAATVICTDKTGTLTLGHIKPEAFYGSDGTKFLAGKEIKKPEIPMFALGLALGATTELGSATERGISEFVQGLGYDTAELKRKWQKRDALAFDSHWKYAASLYNHPTNPAQILFVTGAPEILLERSAKIMGLEGEEELSDRRRHEIQAEWRQHADQGDRIIGIAMRKNIRQSAITRGDVHDLTFLGILTMSDPIRPEVTRAIAESQAAGVAVKIITGDYAITARGIARLVGLSVNDEKVLDGSDLESMSDRELEDRIDEITVFARVNPIDKQRIVKALQKRGEIVAMTGDGVNDAVALKSADIGVAMGSGKDIAKDAADLVLLDDSFATIVAAIKEGRVIRDNIRKVITFLLSTNIAEVAIFVVSLAMKLPLPMVPAQILWINLVTDGTSDLALSMEPAERGVMQRKPENPQAPLLNKEISWHMLLSGLALTIGAIGLYWYLVQQTNIELNYIRTMIFTFVAVACLLSTWSYRSLQVSFFKQGWRGNPWLLISAAFSLALQCVALYVPMFQRWFETVPLAWSDWGIIAGLALIVVIVIDMRKSLMTWARPRI